MKRYVRMFMLAVLAAGTACGGGSSSMLVQNQQASVFVTGEDAPVSSVVAFNITINSITLNNSSTSVPAMTTPTAVDFGRLVGLRSLLAFNTIPAGTYNSATFTFATSPAPKVSYVDLTTTPPSLGTATGTLSSNTVTVAFPSGAPLVVGGNDLGGLHMVFDMRQ